MRRIHYLLQKNINVLNIKHVHQMTTSFKLHKLLKFVRQAFH